METSLLGFGPEWWNVAMLAMLGAVVFAACLLAATATGVIIVQRKENVAQARSLEEYRMEAAQKIAQARALAARAVERAATANERAARLEKETAEFRGRNTELVREEAAREASAATPVPLPAKPVPVPAKPVPGPPPTPSREEFLAAMGKAPPGRADISYVRECASCLWLADWLSSHLREAGWRVKDTEAVAEAAPPPADTGHLASVENQTWVITVLARHPSDNSHHKSDRSYHALMAALSASLGHFAELSETKDEVLAEDHVKVFIAARP